MKTKITGLALCAVLVALCHLAEAHVVTGSTPAALAAKNATKNIPIVFLGTTNPVATGLVDSLARPGGNLTGLTNIHTEQSGKRLELPKETIPKLSRVAVLWDGLYTQLERKQISSRRTWSEGSFYGGNQCQRFRECVQSSNQGA